MNYSSAKKSDQMHTILPLEHNWIKNKLLKYL